MKRLILLLAAAVAVALPGKAVADRLDDMIAPAFHPVTFEDPRAISEARFLYVHHTLNDKFVTEGGNVNVYALQLRAALNDRLAIIATKDGFIDFNPNAVLPKKTGLADLEAGLKYAFYKDEQAGTIISAALRYLIPTGDKEVLQGQGKGSIHPSISAATALSDSFTLTAGSGLRLAMDTKDSSFWDVDAQLDYRIPTDAGDFYPLIGASLIQVIDDGTRLPIADEGQDFFNFGASKARGKSIVTGVAGLRYRPCSKQVELGGSYQFPFEHKDGNRVIDSRWMFDAIYRF
jgi:hypothetical protein